MPETLCRLLAPFAIKEVSEDERTFEGYASTWDLDLGDDVIHRGAFKDALNEWRDNGQAMPLLNSHNAFDIFSGVGQMIDAKEDRKGLWTKWEVVDGEDGNKVLTRLRPSKRTGRPIVGSMSIGYEPLAYDFEDSDESKYGQIRNLRKVRLMEVSLVLFPMNPAATINASTVKMHLAHATPDVVEHYRQMHVALGKALAEGEAEPEPEAEQKSPEGSHDTPGSPTLADLTLRRLRSRSLALRAGIITH